MSSDIPEDILIVITPERAKFYRQMFPHYTVITLHGAEYLSHTTVGRVVITSEVARSNAFEDIADVLLAKPEPHEVYVFEMAEVDGYGRLRKRT
jgi:hypothetical protein